MNKDLSSLSLYDLMAEDYTLWMKKNKKFGYDLEIEHDLWTDSKVTVEGIHENAIESFASFCRNFLFCYDHVQNLEYSNMFKMAS